MKEKERDRIDDLFRSKLQDFEVETMPGDWDAIASRLPEKASVPFRRTLRYWAAAAVVSLLLATGGIYLSKEEIAHTPVVQDIKRQTEELKTSQYEKRIEPIVQKEQMVPARTATMPTAIKNSVANVRSRARSAVPSTVALQSLSEGGGNTDVASDVDSVSEVVAVVDSVTEKVVLRSNTPQSLLADADPVSRKAKEKPARKWGLGMGAGGVTAGTTNSVNSFALRSGTGVDQQLSSMNAILFNSQLPKTDIEHNTPISFGLSVSRFLNDRFSLQTGLNYSFLSSEWTTNSRYHGEVKQKLHFIGIPLSLSYKIAEWNRFQLYAAAGGMTEVNVAGKVRTRLLSEGEEFSSKTESLRMKEWLWSVNARAGVSYPVIRFVSAFAEVGAAYYFDNGTDIETIHSEKPFNVSLQFGFRLGF